MEGLGAVSHGRARSGGARSGEVWLGWARLGEVRYGTARLGGAGLGRAGQGAERSGEDWSATVRRGMVGRGLDRHGEPGQGRERHGEEHHMNSAEFNQRQLAIVRLIEEADEEHRQLVDRASNSERAYRRRQAIARQAVRGETPPPKNADEVTDRAELLAFADGAGLGDLRYQRDLDKGMLDAAKLLMKARVQELSSLQSEGGLARSEAEFIRTSPHIGP